MKMNLRNAVATTFMIAWVLALAGCTKEREEPGFTVAECRKDLEKLQLGFRKVQEIGKDSVGKKGPSSVIAREIAAASEIRADIGPCGASTQKAFDAYKSWFSHALGVEYEPDYQGLSSAEQIKRKHDAMENFTKAREALDAEVKALKARAR